MNDQIKPKKKRHNPPAETESVESKIPVGEQQKIPPERADQATGSVDTTAESKQALEAGAKDLKRAQAVQAQSERLARLSSAIAAEGVVDLSQGAELLAVSEDVEVMSAMVGLMSTEDFEIGLELARIAGELEAIADVLERMEISALAKILDGRGERLKELGINHMLRAGGKRCLAKMMASTGQKLGGLGEAELAEATSRLAKSEVYAAQSEALAQSGEELVVQGVAEMVMGNAALQDEERKEK